MTVAASRPVVRDAALVGLGAAVLGALGSWRPSFWYDEVATLHSSGRSPGDLARMLGNIDAVHGLYYALMHQWLAVFGPSEFSARLPSALAVGIAAAGVVVLGSLLGSRRLGVLSGLVFLILPRVTWSAVEARGYAMTAAVAVWLTVLLVAAPRIRSRARRNLAWTGYAALLALSVILFVHTVTLVAAHLVTVLLSAQMRRRWAGWLVATVAALAVAAPVAVLVRDQSGQVGWIPPLDGQVVRALLEYQWFLGSPVFGALLAIVCAVAALASARRSGDGTWRRVLPVALPWMALPTAVLLGYSLAVAPMYLDRYLTFTTPAVALCGGMALARITTRWWTTALTLLVLVAAATPAYLGQRSADAKPSAMDFSELNDFAAAHVRPGDCVLFGTAAWNPASQRLAKDVDPESFDGTRDIGLGRTAAAEGWLWDEERPVADLAGDLAACPTVWYFTDGERDDTRTIRHTSNELWTLPPYHFESSPQCETFTAAGLRIVDRWAFRMSQVVLLRR